MEKPYTAKSIINQLQKYPEFSNEKIKILIENCITNTTNENGIIPPEQLRMITILIPITYVSVLTNGGQTDQAERAAAAISNELPGIVKKYVDAFKQSNQHTSKDIINLVSDISNSIGNVVATNLTGLNTKIKDKISSIISTTIRYLSYCNLKPDKEFKIKWLDLENTLSGGWEWSDVGHALFKYGLPLAAIAGTVGLSLAAPGLAPVIPVATQLGTMAYQNYTNNQLRAEAANIADENAIFNNLNSTIGVGVEPDLSGLSANTTNSYLPPNMTSSYIPPNITSSYIPPNITSSYTPSNITNTSANRYSMVNTTSMTPIQTPASIPLNNSTVIPKPLFDQTTSINTINNTQYTLPIGFRDRILDAPLSGEETMKLAMMNRNQWVDYVKNRGDKLTIDEVNAHYSPPKDSKTWYNMDFNAPDPEERRILVNRAVQISKLKNLETPLTDDQVEFLKSMSNKDWEYYKSLRGNNLSRDEYLIYTDRNLFFNRKNYGRNAVRDLFRSIDYTPEIDLSVAKPVEIEQSSGNNRYSIFNPNTGESENVMGAPTIDIDEKIKQIPGVNKYTRQTNNEENVFEEVKKMRENKSLNEKLTGQDPGKYTKTNTQNIDMGKQQTSYSRTTEPSSTQTDDTVIDKQPEIFPNTDDTFNTFRIERLVNSTDGSIKFSITPDTVKEFSGKAELTVDPNGNAVYTIPKNTSAQEFAKIINVMNNIKPVDTPKSSSILWTGLKTILGVVGLPITTGVYLIKGAYAVDPVLGQFITMSLGPAMPFVTKMIYKIYEGFFNVLNSGLKKSDKKVAKSLYNFNKKIGGYISTFKDTFSDKDIESLGNVLAQTVPAMVQDYMTIKQKTAVYNQQVEAYKQKEKYMQQRAAEKQAAEQRRIDIENQNIDLENARTLRSNREERERAQLRNENKKQHYKEDLEEYQDILDYNAASDIIKMKNAEMIHKWNVNADKIKNDHSKYNALIDVCENGLQAVGDIAKGFMGFNAVESGSNLLKQLSQAVQDRLYDSQQTLALANTFAKSAGEAFKEGQIEAADKFYKEAYKYEQMGRDMFQGAMKYNDQAIDKRQEEIGKKYGFIDGAIHKIGNIARSIGDYNYWSNQQTKPLEEILATKRPPPPRAPDLEVVPEDISDKPELLKKHLPDAAQILPEYIGPPPTMPLDMFSMPQTSHVFKEVIPAEKRRLEEKKLHEKDVLAYLKTLTSKNNRPASNILINPGPHTRGLQTHVQPVRIVKNQQLPLNINTNVAAKRPIRIIKASQIPSKRRRRN